MGPLGVTTTTSTDPCPSSLDDDTRAPRSEAPATWRVMSYGQMMNRLPQLFSSYVNFSLRRNLSVTAHDPAPLLVEQIPLEDARRCFECFGRDVVWIVGPRRHRSCVVLSNGIVVGEWPDYHLSTEAMSCLSTLFFAVLAIQEPGISEGMKSAYGRVWTECEQRLRAHINTTTENSSYWARFSTETAQVQLRKLQVAWNEARRGLSVEAELLLCMRCKTQDLEEVSKGCVIQSFTPRS